MSLNGGLHGRNQGLPRGLPGRRDSSSRRNLFPSHNSSSRRQSSGADSRPSGFRSGGHSSTGFYGRHTPMTSPDSPQDDTWQPGQYIPQSEPSESPPDFYSLIVQMKTSITSEIQKVQSSIDTLSDRVDKLEEDFTSTANRSHLNQTPSSTSSSDLSSDSGGRRKRRISVDLANTVRTVHNNLPEENQLKIQESIDSEHNKKVVGFVKEEISSSSVDGNYSACDVKRSLAQYRRTLLRKQKDSDAASESRKMHARKQRIFERRSRFVKDSEKHMWNDITANMMSDEEDIGGNAFKVRAPEWRSEELNKLLKDLDARADVAATNRAHPRRNRVHGTPLKVPAPASVSAWMIDEKEE